MCDEKCKFRLIRPEGLLVCTLTCELDKEGVDNINVPADFNLAPPGADIHGEARGQTHLCQIHNEVRIRRYFKYPMPPEAMEVMTEYVP
jgi:hypothetical protein